MIVITGAAGFIGSCLVEKLNKNDFFDLILVDDFSVLEKSKNYETKKYSQKINRNNFFDWLDHNHKLVEFIFHLGAITDTTETNLELLSSLNTEYTKTIWRKSADYGIPLIYASSAATYGDGALGFDDSLSPFVLTPLNAYGESKNNFDKWALMQEKQPFFNIGLKFFNVYGPNEYHKGKMASVILHAYQQILETHKLSLFKSHNKDFADGEQLRDFIYVKDIIDVIYFFMNHRDPQFNGIYNLGTGQAHSFNELAKAIFKAMNLPENIAYVDMPTEIQDKYQYFTEAKMEKLKNIGYTNKFYTLEDGVSDYIKNYLMGNMYF